MRTLSVALLKTAEPLEKPRRKSCHRGPDSIMPTVTCRPAYPCEAGQKTERGKTCSGCA